MQTHMNNTKAHQLALDVLSQQQFLNHQQALHGKVKPVVVTKRPTEMKITSNNKNLLNHNPQEHVNRLFKNLHAAGKKSKSGIDNKATHQTPKRPASSKIEKHVQKEHQREMSSLLNRIANCKSIGQRKKDNTDPIVNPIYFMKQPNEMNSTVIDKYSKKILAKNRPKSGVPLTHTHQMQMTSPQIKGPFAILASRNTRPASGNPRKQQSSSDLPACTYKALLDHIVNNTLFKDTDMKVLYVRMCHKYGQQNVDVIWQLLMDHLQQ